MGEEKDLGIKLFGKKIIFTENEKVPAVSGHDSGEVRSGDCKASNFGVDDESEAVKVIVEGEIEKKSPDSTGLPNTDKPKASTDSSDSPKTPSINEENGTLKPPNTDNEKSDTTESQQKTLKKPDKILPCPRCNSMDTKFCYYNNYNVSQPRHFCKSCQRYWTAGGTIRNMPVGAGRRKSKSSDSHCRHMTVSEALRAARIDDASNGIHNTVVKSSETVLSFGAQTPLFEPVSSVLSIAEKKVSKSIQNGLYKQKTSIPCKEGKYIDDCSSGSSMKTLNPNMEGKKEGMSESETQNIHGFPSQVPFHPPLPWPWNSTVPVQAMYPSGFPFPYYPTPYWNYNVPGSWNIPWLPPPPQATNQDAPIQDPKSQILGKHSREGVLLRPITDLDKEDSKQNKSETSVVVPKTLRIDDLDEEAKGSIFASLGIKKDSISKAFQPKKDEKNHVVKPSPALQANPAAMSRSLRFHERV